MVTVTDYQVLLKNEDWKRLSTVLTDKIDSIAFEFKQPQNIFIDMLNGELDVNHWKNEFNLKLISISTNYAYMYTYYEKLEMVDIYEKYDRDKVGIHFWFSYEAESLLTRIFSAIDNIYHIVNMKYNLQIKHELGFRGKVVKALETHNKSLADYLSRVRYDLRYKGAGALRNDFTHNHSPLNLTSGVNKTKNKVSFGKGKYTKNEEVLSNIDEFLLLLKEIVGELKRYI